MRCGVEWRAVHVHDHAEIIKKPLMFTYLMTLMSADRAAHQQLHNHATTNSVNVALPHMRPKEGKEARQPKETDSVAELLKSSRHLR